MKKQLHKCTAMMLLFALLFCTGCGQGANDAESAEDKQMVTEAPAPTATPTPDPAPTATLTPTSAPTATPTQLPHEHVYTESTTKAATCIEAGEKNFACGCGDAYTETIEATGHKYGAYVSNNDATYTTDGTETATCACGSTDTRTADGSKLEYTYTNLAKTMYAKSSVNVRNLPSTDGEKLGALSEGEGVTVTGKCNETGWYRIDFHGSIAYVSNSYLQNDKPVEATPTPGPIPEYDFTDEFEISNPAWYLGDDGIYYCYTFSDSYSEWNGKTLAEYCEATGMAGAAFNGPFMDMVRFSGDKFGDYVFGTHWIVSYTRLGREIEVQLPF